MTTEPTDAELKAMWQLHAADIGGIFYYARAVLAKWGTPTPASQPVAAPSGQLTDSQIADIYFEALGSQHLREQDRKMVMRFARAVESEVQKQDEALIWLMLAALKHHTEQTRPIARTDGAITAAILRLKGKP